VVLVGPLGGVTMSLHKLSAGHGYDYLIRQVSVLQCARGSPAMCGLCQREGILRVATQ
jgi:hypothetical protein